MDFLKKAPRARFGALLIELDNLFSCGVDQYPKDVVAAHSLLVNYQAPKGPITKPPPTKTEEGDDNDDALTFTQVGSATAGTDGTLHAHITCFSCKSKGHYSNMCPSTDGVQLFQVEQPDDADTGVGFTFTSIESKHQTIPTTWVLLDSQSTVSVFCNKFLLTRICRCNTPLKVFTNGGQQISTLIGEVKNFGTVWYNPHSLANILSLAQVRKRFRVTMDTAVEASISIHHLNGTVMKFTEF